MIMRAEPANRRLPSLLRTSASQLSFWPGYGGNG